MNPGHQAARSNKFLNGAPSRFLVLSVVLLRVTLLAPNVWKRV